MLGVTLLLATAQSRQEWVAADHRECLGCRYKNGPELRVTLRLSKLVYFETALSSVRAWSIWSYAYVTISAVVIASPLRASDS